MKHPVTLYPTQPDHGDRFARVWENYHNEARHAFIQRALTSAQIVIGAVLGIGAAVWVVL